MGGGLGDELYCAPWPRKIYDGLPQARVTFHIEAQPGGGFGGREAVRAGVNLPHIVGVRNGGRDYHQLGVAQPKQRAVATKLPGFEHAPVFGAIEETQKGFDVVVERDHRHA